MRSSTLVFSICLLAATATAIHPHRPAATPSPHFQRRLSSSRQEWHNRDGIFGGFLGNDNDNKPGTDSGTTEDTSSSSTTSSSSSSTTESSSSTTPSSSTSTRPTSTSSSTSSSSSALQSSTNSQGSVVFLTSTIDLPSSTAAPIASATSSDSADSDSGSHTGLIVGVSVVGGLAILGALIFLWMKFGGRRFSDYDKDDADIKWPELKADENAAAMQPLPARRTGGAGFDMGDESDTGHYDVAGGGGDAHSLNDYGAKQHDSMVGSSTALHTSQGGMGMGGYGGGGSVSYGTHQTGMDPVYDDEDAYGHGSEQQPGVTGYYDPYGSYNTGEQVFYPEQGGNATGGHHDYGAGASGYAPHQDAYGVNTSPPSDPYRMGGGHGAF